jgi:hypothetical protein
MVSQKIKTTMVQLQITTKEERGLWNEMKKVLKERQGYQFKKQFFPFRMAEWEKENSNIESEYREKILALNKERILIREEERKREEHMELLEAAEGLLKLKTATFPVKKNRKHTEKKGPVRRSKRLAEKM